MHQIITPFRKLPRKEMLARRRAAQLSRIGGGHFTEVPKKLRSQLPPPVPGENLINLDDGRRIHPTKGERVVTAYERLIGR